MNKEDFRKRLIEAETPKDILEIFRQEEATISEG
jgi:mannitol/fructose-specific phosphotransferase system IIA component (Ntr-type)